MPNGEYIMMIEFLNKEDLILRNKIAKYPLAIAEKDYFLAIVSKIIFESSIKDKLIFKGGTALHHVYLPQLRFSEDLDFSSGSIEMDIEEVRSVFSNFDFLSIKKDFVSNATIKIEKLQYFGPLNQPNSLKVEIDFLQSVILPPLELDYVNFYGVKTKVRVMDVREITAEKIRAMSDRVRYRDFYDFAMIMVDLKVNLKKTLSLVPQKEIRFDISVNKILDNWYLARKEKESDFSSIYYTKELTDEIIENELKKLNFKDFKALTY